MKYTQPNDIVWDPFCGSGTLVLEAYRSKRNSIGTDVNPTATLISRTKSTPLDPVVLKNANDELFEKLKDSKAKKRRFYIDQGILNGNLPILEQWFSEASLLKLSHVLYTIRNSSVSKPIVDFQLCALSAILKRSSYWLNTSIKSQKDPDKHPGEPEVYFRQQIDLMTKANACLYSENASNTTAIRVFRHDIRRSFSQTIEPVDVIITSPPYVVSYDYSDIFRLSTHFLFFHHDTLSFRKQFIGTRLQKQSHKGFEEHLPEDPILHDIKDACIKKTLKAYYKDMRLFFESVKDKVVPNGKMIMVVGDTRLRGVEIPNSYLLSKIGISAGWRFQDCKERNIPVKILPTTRDPVSGRFSANSNGAKESYKIEYILAFTKPAL